MSKIQYRHPNPNILHAELTFLEAQQHFNMRYDEDRNIIHSFIPFCCNNTGDVTITSIFTKVYCDGINEYKFNQNKKIIEMTLYLNSCEGTKKLVQRLKLMKDKGGE